MPFVVWTRSLNRLFVGLILPEILRCINFGVLAWNCPFTPILGEFLGAYFPRWRHPSSWPPKGPSLGGNTSFEPFSVRIGATVRAGRVTKKKMDRMTKKSQKCYISCIMGKPLINRFVPKSLGGWCRRLNHVCPVLNWNLHGLQFYRGVEFSIFLLIFAWANSAALMRCLWFGYTQDNLQIFWCVWSWSYVVDFIRILL